MALTGMRGNLSSDTPIGMLLIRTLDHFVLGLGCGGGELAGRVRKWGREALIWGAASWSMCGVMAGPLVITKLPLAVYLLLCLLGLKVMGSLKTRNRALPL